MPRYILLGLLLGALASRFFPEPPRPKRQLHDGLCRNDADQHENQTLQQRGLVEPPFTADRSSLAERPHLLDHHFTSGWHCERRKCGLFVRELANHPIRRRVRTRADYPE